MITLQNVTRKFGSFTAVDNLSITVSKGEVLGFLGPNGAGKTTTMRMISGFLMPSAGEITVCGYDTVKDPVEVKKHIGYMPEVASSYNDMTVLSFLSFIAQARGLFGSEEEKAVARVVDTISLNNVLYQPIETLSKGYKRRVGLAQALVHDPDVLILDEPTEGLDPNQKRDIRTLIRRLRENKAIIISTHVLEEVEAMCSRAVIIDKGKIVLDDTPRALLSLSDTHQTLFFLIPDYQKERAETIFNEMPQIVLTDVHQESEDAFLFTMQPRERESATADIVEALRRQDVKILDMFVEKGRLEEVFYAFTSSDRNIKENAK
ncbi:MAG: ABC transporter ATP-binding protein [Alphaproteobacteria bacterium]|nr:ABC transporter ATP-binding protein [Alphaproteobacteria bacterium]MBO4643067.1 ABC transporter ATP-binding protein [Alphaproteobacteria bacterium]